MGLDGLAELEMVEGLDGVDRLEEEEWKYKAACSLCQWRVAAGTMEVSYYYKLIREHGKELMEVWLQSRREKGFDNRGVDMRVF